MKSISFLCKSWGGRRLDTHDFKAGVTGCRRGHLGCGFSFSVVIVYLLQFLKSLVKFFKIARVHAKFKFMVRKLGRAIEVHAAV